MLFLDADGATDIRDMSRLEKAIDELTTDYKVPAVAVGSRAHLQDEAVAKVCCHHTSFGALKSY